MRSPFFLFFLFFSSISLGQELKGSGMGEGLMVEFKEALDTVDYPFYEIGVSNGYCKSTELWKKHSRMKRMLLSKTRDPILVLKFQNSYYPQVFKWPTDLLEIGNGDLVTLEIKEVYHGAEFEDTALSDIYFMGAH